jgi:hypothetical protein
MTKLFAAKAQLFRAHWRPRQVRFGVRMLGLWAFTRMAALGVLQWVRPKWGPSWRAWREIWRRRAEWSNAEWSNQPETVAAREARGETPRANAIALISKG